MRFGPDSLRFIHSSCWRPPFFQRLANFRAARPRPRARALRATRVGPAHQTRASPPPRPSRPRPDSNGRPPSARRGPAPCRRAPLAVRGAGCGVWVARARGRIPCVGARHPKGAEPSGEAPRHAPPPTPTQRTGTRPPHPASRTRWRALSPSRPPRGPAHPRGSLAHTRLPTPPTRHPIPHAMAPRRPPTRSRPKPTPPPTRPRSSPERTPPKRPTRRLSPPAPPALGNPARAPRPPGSPALGHRPTGSRNPQPRQTHPARPLASLARSHPPAHAPKPHSMASPAPSLTSRLLSILAPSSPHNAARVRHPGTEMLMPGPHSTGEPPLHARPARSHSAPTLPPPPARSPSRPQATHPPRGRAARAQAPRPPALDGHPAPLAIRDPARAGGRARPKPTTEGPNFARLW